MRRLVAGFREERVKRRHHLRAFANGSGNSLDRSRAHVADREYSGQGGFERPLNVRARADKAAVIECHTRPRQPSGMRLGADEQKQMSDRALYFFAGSRASDSVLPLECRPALRERSTVVWARTSMFGIERNARDQVARHA